ncbi:MAG: GNAT family N-acetyltransferase [Chloroflexi bacterium]|nr:GNAT family N-acetyltransferase [Chloroflexota bacterium]
MQTTITPVGPTDLSAFIALMNAIGGEESPPNPDAGRGVMIALARYDFTRSDSCSMLMARVAGTPAGYAAVAHVPKADARTGFLFVDELYVLRAFRRRGVARALLQRIKALARERGLAGVRLLVRPENDAARRLYREDGFSEQATLLCEKRLP